MPYRFSGFIQSPAINLLRTVLYVNYLFFGGFSAFFPKPISFFYELSCNIGEIWTQNTILLAIFYVGEGKISVFRWIFASMWRCTGPPQAAPCLRSAQKSVNFQNSSDYALFEQLFLVEFACWGADIALQGNLWYYLPYNRRALG